MNMREPPGNDVTATEREEAANEVITPAMRLQDLIARHRALDRRIIEMHAFPSHNQILIQRLKKEKLRLKDAIERLKDELIPDLNA